jgi:carbon storage regulator
MLVLGRKQNEKITIGKDITITVARLGKSRVSLAVDAPPDVRVVRTELMGTDTTTQAASPD